MYTSNTTITPDPECKHKLMASCGLAGPFRENCTNRIWNVSVALNSNNKMEYYVYLDVYVCKHKR